MTLVLVVEGSVSFVFSDCGGGVLLLHGSFNCCTVRFRGVFAPGRNAVSRALSPCNSCRLPPGLPASAKCAFGSSPRSSLCEISNPPSHTIELSAADLLRFFPRGNHFKPRSKFAPSPNARVPGSGSGPRRELCSVSYHSGKNLNSLIRGQRVHMLGAKRVGFVCFLGLRW